MRKDCSALPVSACPLISIFVEPYQSGLRIEAVLTQQLRNYDVWKIQRLVEWGAVTVNHQPANLRRQLNMGDCIEVRLLEPPQVRYPPESYPLAVVYDDPWIVCVNKAPGIIAHPTGTTQSGTLCHFLQSHFDTQSKFPGLLRPGIVHRLDRETSGVIVIAKTHLAHKNLVSSFEQSRVSKTYIAIVEGTMGQDTGIIDLPIGQANVDSRVLMSTQADALRPKLARTSWKVLRRISAQAGKTGYTVVAAKPKTGRNHQIRVHFAAIGHPLVGDEFYLKSGKFKPARPKKTLRRRQLDEKRCTISGLNRHALHASQIELAHPITGVWLKLQAGLPADMLRAFFQVQGSSMKSHQ